MNNIMFIACFLFIAYMNQVNGSYDSEPYGDSQYSVPRKTYYTPRQSYSAPRQSYSAPRQSYSAPRQSYSAPRQSYHAPRQPYHAPSESYSARYSYGPVKRFTKAVAGDEVTFIQENAYSPLTVSLNLMSLNPGADYILRFHQRGIPDNFVSGLLSVNPCLDYGGVRFSGVNQSINYNEDDGDIGKLHADANGNIQVTRETTQFSLFGKDSILGRTAILFELDDFPQEIDFRLPTFAAFPVFCDMIGIDARPATSESSSGVSKRSAQRSNTYPSRQQYNKKYYSFNKYHEYKVSDEFDSKPRVALAIINGAELLREVDIYFGAVLFEQENSNAPLNITGTFFQRSDESSSLATVSISINEGRFFATQITDFQARCLATGDPFHPGTTELLTGAPLALDNEVSNTGLLGVDFGFIDTKRTLYGPNSIIGRNIVFRDAGIIISCGHIGHYTPGSLLFDAIVIHHLRKPILYRADRSTFADIIQSIGLNN